MITPPLPYSAERLTEVLTRFLQHEVERAGFSRVVLGVSGGLDSALVLELAVRAFGRQAVLGLSLPHRSSSPASAEHAGLMFERSGCRHETIEITAMLDAFQQVAGVSAEERLRLGNKMARERMALLYDRAARDRALVLGTSNKTELLLGYSTRWGDSACDLNPIGDLYKCQVRSLSRALSIPPVILDKPPSADLWPGQTDEAEFGFSYDEADAVLWYLVDARGSVAGAAQECGVSPELVRRVVEAVRKSQFKRNLPPICKLQSRTVGVDFRFPRDWDE